MVLTLSISAEAEARLREKAAAAGEDVQTYAARRLERLVAPPRSLREISGPIAGQYAREGMTEDQLAEFLEQEKRAMRAEKRARRAG